MTAVCLKSWNRQSYERTLRASPDFVGPGTAILQISDFRAGYALPSPPGRNSKREQKSDAHGPAIDGAFAPALEHPDQSNNEEKNGESGCTLDPQ